MFDPEIPAGYQDADIEMAEYEMEARFTNELRRHGTCPHHSGIGGMVDSIYGVPEGWWKCTDICGLYFRKADLEVISNGYVEWYGMPVEGQSGREVPDEDAPMVPSTKDLGR